MLANYLKIALRNIIKFKAYSIINILGLAIGITGCVLIMFFVADELSYDKFNNDAKDIYRICLKAKINEMNLNLAATPAPLAETLIRDFPEVITAVRLSTSGNMTIRFEDKAFVENNFIWADSTFFDVFTCEFVRGNKKTALTEPHTVVLTEAMAKKYFGNIDPVGKIMNFEDNTPYRVAAIIKEFPRNAHFKFDILASMSSREDSRNTVWLSNNFQTYAKLKPQSDYKQFENKMPALIIKYIGPQFMAAVGSTLEDFIKANNYYNYYLQPLLSIHLYSGIDAEIGSNSDITYVYALSIIAVFILLIACINFMNLSTARSSTRAKEVGIRKVLGSTYLQLIRQFLSESIMLSFISLIFSVIIIAVVLPYFNEFTNRDLGLGNANYFIVIPLIVLFVLVVGLIAGSYPAFILSKFKPIIVLKGKIQNTNAGRWLRSSLVVFQFSISVIMFVCTLILIQQINYINTKKLGYDKENILLVKRGWGLGNNIEAFKQELLNNPEIKSVGGASNFAWDAYSNTVFIPEGRSINDRYVSWILITDSDFQKTLNIKMASGRYFSNNYAADSLAVVLNETAVKFMGIDEPVGKTISSLPRPDGTSVKYKIVGVIKDFYYEKLNIKIRPLVIFLAPNNLVYYGIRYKSNDPSNIIDITGKTWKKYAGLAPFEYVFFDESYSSLYATEQKAGTIFLIFSMLAIFVACLGLFGLAAFTTEQKTKEIGIRKTLGASVKQIILMLITKFIKYVVIANIIAWPIAYFIMNKWLQSFAYRIEINVYPFVLAAIFALLIASLTVIYQAVKAATANPIESLKYE
ncbi:MAG: ABC transporter permease [bacterium]